MYKNLTKICAAAVVALGLAACGGGGGSDRADTGMEMPDPTPMPHVCDDGASQACVDARAMELADLEADDDATVGQVNAARTALTNAQTALSDHNTAVGENDTVSGLIDDAVTAIADIDDESTPNAVAAGRAAIKAAQDSLDGMENLYADDKTALQGRIDTLNASYNPIEMAVHAAAANSAALTKEMAIATEAAQAAGADAGLGGSAATIGTSDGNYEGPTISRDRDGTTITVTVHGATDAEDETFVKAEDLTSSTNPGQMLTRTMEADANGNIVTEVVIVYTDIAEPTATPFADVAGQTLDANPETTNGTDFQSLNITNTNLAMMKTGGITSTGAGAITLLAAVADDPGTADVDETVEAFQTSATFNGAPGTLTCGGATDCTATLDADGDITAVTGGWYFTPDAGATSDVADANYLYYGAWLQRTANAGGTDTYDEVETFAGAVGHTDSGSVAAVSGIAEYEGGAAGVYVHKTFETDGTSQATSGHFSADASLTAYFSGGATPAEKADTLVGTIDNFVLSGGEDQDWSVALQSDTDLTTDGIQSSDTGTQSGTARGNVMGTENAGSFTATYHGSTDDGSGNLTVQPAAVTGEFNSVFSNGSVAGAFGANKK